MRSEVQVAAQHLPVLVACHERHLRDIESCLEKSARRLMAKVVKMQIVDLERLAGSAEGCAE
mgnify:CR=1 FL=1